MASDLSELKDYAIDLSKIYSNASGEYETVVAIEDIYGNKTEKNIKIKILEKWKKKQKRKIIQHLNKVVVKTKLAIRNQ